MELCDGTLDAALADLPPPAASVHARLRLLVEVRTRRGRGGPHLLVVVPARGSVVVLGDASTHLPPPHHRMQVARGVAYMHSRGSFHSDLKPANVLLRRGVAKVADLGLAKLAAGVLSLSSAGTGGAPPGATLRGTPLYRRVAALLGEGSAASPTPPRALCSDPAPFASLQWRYGPASDVYSFGLMAWEVLTGDRVRHSMGGERWFGLEVLTGDRVRHTMGGERGFGLQVLTGDRVCHAMGGARGLGLEVLTGDRVRRRMGRVTGGGVQTGYRPLYPSPLPLLPTHLQPYAAETVGGSLELLRARVLAGARPDLKALAPGTPARVAPLLGRCWAARQDRRPTMAQVRASEDGGEWG